MFHFTYVLECIDGKHYIGSSSDLDRRLQEHEAGSVFSTRSRRPVRLVYYEACLSAKGARARERYFKTGFGRSFLKKRLTEMPE